MRLVPETLGSANQIDVFFAETRNVLGPLYADLLEAAGLSPGKQEPSKLPLRDLLKLFSILNVSLDSVMNDTVDFGAMRAQFLGDDILPARFVKRLALSSRFTSIYMLRYISERYGQSAAHAIMRHFQLKDSHLEDPTRTNNVTLPTGISRYMYEYHGSDVVEKMGESFLDLFSKSAPGKQLRSTAGVREMLETFFEDVAPKHIEKNYRWKIHSSGPGHITIKGTPEGALLEEFGEAQVITEATFLQRKGFLKALPQLHGDYMVHIDVTKRLSLGDACDMYTLYYMPLENGMPSSPH